MENLIADGWTIGDCSAKCVPTFQLPERSDLLTGGRSCFDPLGAHTCNHTSSVCVCITCDEGMHACIQPKFKIKSSVFNNRYNIIIPYRIKQIHYVALAPNRHLPAAGSGAPIIICNIIADLVPSCRLVVQLKAPPAGERVTEFTYKFKFTGIQ